MQRIPSFLRNHQIALAVLIFAVAAGVLFSFFHARISASTAEATELQPTVERAELLTSSDAEALLADSNAVAQREEQPPVTSAPAQVTIVVYVTGAVRAPDVYTLPAEARVKDLVMAAGGLTADADSEQINLAARLKDAEHVHVPRLGEAPSAVTPDAPRGTNVATAGEETININTASVAELDTLPGIGPALAQRIVDYRMEKGPFASPNDLTNVQGIGPTLLEEIVPKISTGTP